jgi:ribosomal protein S21
MAVNVSVMKHGTESSMSLIRRFSKRIQGSGIVRKVKGGRYHLRTQSKSKRRTSALRRVTKREKNAELERMGLAEVKPLRGGFKK